MPRPSSGKLNQNSWEFLSPAPFPSTGGANVQPGLGTAGPGMDSTDYGHKTTGLFQNPQEGSLLELFTA